MHTLSNLPFLTSGTPGIGGRLKQAVEDFIVEEVPAYHPSGAGEHLFLWIEKRGVAAGDLLQHVARTLGISQSNIGAAGMKDKQAVTRQFLSVPAACEPRIGQVESPQIAVLDSTRHGNKLRTGQLRGNRFEIVIRDPADDALKTAGAIAEQIAALGFPNYYGEQRFGHHGATADLGFALLRGEQRAADIPYRRRRFQLKLALSAAQAKLFNTALAERLTDGLLHKVLPGDVMQVAASRGPFVAEDAAVEQVRFDGGETLITGPLFGPKMKSPSGAVADRERGLLEKSGLDAAAFTQFRQLTSGTRRPYIVRPEELQLEPTPVGIRFRFQLPAGVYATTLLREFMKPTHDLPDA